MDDAFIDSEDAIGQSGQLSKADMATGSTQSIGNGAPPGERFSTQEREAAVRALHEGLEAKRVCPFCGSQNPAAAQGGAAPSCPRCTMEDTPATRQATKARIGPWYVLQTRNPAAPGMRYATLLALVAKGQVTARSVVRGPTTHQLWRYAAHVKGLSREFGVCYSCGEAVDRTASHCPHCDRIQEPLGNPDALLDARDNPAPGNGALPSVNAPPPSDGAFVEPNGNYNNNTLPSPRPPAAVPDRARPPEPRIGDTRRRAEGRILSAMELAAALQVAPNAAALQPRRPVRTALLSIVVIGSIAAVAVLYFRPDYRRQAQSMWASLSRSVSSQLDSFQLQHPQATLPAPPPRNFSTPPAAPAPAAPAPTKDDLASASPQMEITPAPQAKPDVEAAPPPDVVTPANPPVSNGPSISIDTDQSSLSAEDVRKLYDQGIDAEGNQDWATAVRCYEQIQTAPKKLQPSDLQIRLNIAKRQLHQ